MSGYQGDRGVKRRIERMFNQSCRASIGSELLPPQWPAIPMVTLYIYLVLQSIDTYPHVVPPVRCCCVAPLLRFFRARKSADTRSVSLPLGYKGSHAEPTRQRKTDMYMRITVVDLFR